MNSGTRGAERWAIVTGSASGLGREVAQQLGARGWRVVWLHHPDDADTPLPTGEFDQRLSLDLAAPDLPDQLTSVAANLPAPSLLVHAAGIGYYSTIDQLDDKLAVDMVRVNFMAPLLLTRFWHEDLSAARGQVMFVSTALADYSATYYGLYTASKSALEHFAASWRVEGSAITVTSVRPGAMRTPFHARSGVPFPVRRAMAPERAARMLLSALGRNGTVSLRRRDALVGAALRLGTLVRAVAPTRKPPTSRPGLNASPHQSVTVTGASRGIGAELARAFAAAGFVVNGWSRSGGGGGGGGNGTRIVDLARTADIPVTNDHGVVLNAGVNYAGAFGQVPLAQLAEMLDVNVIAPVVMLLRVLRRPHAERARSWVVVVSSLAATVGYPGSAAYGAGKHLLSRLTLSVQNAGLVRCLLVTPGPVDTDQAAAASPRGAEARKRRMPPARLAELVLRGLHRGASQLFGTTSWAIASRLGVAAPILSRRAMWRALNRWSHPSPDLDSSP